MVGCLCLPNACLYNGNYLLCYDRQVNNMRKTSWIWCWALYISPLRALTAVSSEAEGILCTPDYSQKNIVGVWPNLTVNSWSLLQLSFRKTDISLGISVIQTVTMHSSAPAPHSVTYLQPERKSLDLYSLQMKCLGKVPPSVVLPYVKSLHCHLAAVFRPKWISWTATILWARMHSSLADWQLEGILSDVTWWSFWPSQHCNSASLAAKLAYLYLRCTHTKCSRALSAWWKTQQSLRIKGYVLTQAVQLSSN